MLQQAGGENIVVTCTHKWMDAFSYLSMPLHLRRDSPVVLLTLQMKGCR